MTPTPLTMMTTFTAVVAIGTLLGLNNPAQAHDSCPPDANAKHPATHPHCSDSSGGGGSPGEIVGNDETDDTLTGTSGDDVIRGLGGNDTLIGLAGNDGLHGDDGDDTLYGDEGNDGLFGGAGNDIMYGGDDNDRFFPFPGHDQLYGGDGDEDWITVNTDQRLIVVNFSSATVFPPVAPAGVVAGTVLDVISGDIVEATSIEKVNGTANDDYYYGGDADEWFGGGRGDDVFFGGGGNDFIGADRGNDRVVGGPGNDQLRGAEHTDTFEFNASDFTAGEQDVVEDFNPLNETIILNGLYVIGTDTTQNLGGKGKSDTIVSVSLSDGGPEAGTIVFWDVSLDVSFFTN